MYNKKDDDDELHRLVPVRAGILILYVILILYGLTLTSV